MGQPLEPFGDGLKVWDNLVRNSKITLVDVWSTQVKLSEIEASEIIGSYRAIKRHLGHTCLNFRLQNIKASANWQWFILRFVLPSGIFITVIAFSQVGSGQTNFTYNIWLPY